MCCSCLFDKIACASRQEEWSLHAPLYLTKIFFGVQQVIQFFSTQSMYLPVQQQMRYKPGTKMVDTAFETGQGLARASFFRQVDKYVSQTCRNV